MGRGGGGGVDREEGSVEVGQTRALGGCIAALPLPFARLSPKYPGFGFSTVANSQTVI